MDIEEYVAELVREADASLEATLKGLAIELWSDKLGKRFWLVADTPDAELRGEPRGTIYTASEAQMLIRITDRETLMQVIKWKIQFDGVVAEVILPAHGKHTPGG